MPIDIAAKLAACRTYTESRPMLEMLGASKSSHELMQLYFAQPENSPYRVRFLDTVVQEMEDGIETKKVGDGGADKGNIKENHIPGEEEKKLKEYEITGPLNSTSSSSDKPAPEGTDKGITVGDSAANPTENQMKEMPGGMPGMQQPQMGIPGMPPEMAQQMEQTMAKMPPMNPMQQMRYIQEMVKSMVTPLYQAIPGIKETLSKLDTKIQEIQIKSVPLNIPGGDSLVMPTGPIQEIGRPGYETPGYSNGAQPPPPRKDITAKRQLIMEKDTILRATKNHQDVSQMYQ